MNLTRRLLPVLALVLILSSCAPRRADIALLPSEVSPSRLVELVEEADAQLVTMEGEGTVSFDSPEVAGTATFELSLRKPDSLLISFEGPFGIDVGTLFLSRSLFVMYNSMENHVITGIPTPRAIRSVVPFDLTYDQILNAFTGAFPIVERDAPPLSYTIDDEQFLLVYACGRERCSYWVDPGGLMVRRYRREDGEGRVLLEASSSGMIEDEGVRMPRRVTMEFPEERRRVVIHFSRADLNPSEVSFDHIIPSNARRTTR